MAGASGAQLVMAAADIAVGAMSAYASNELSAYQAETANKIREGNNKVLEVVAKRNAAITGLQRWRQEVSNKRVYSAVAANQEALATNYNRARDQRTRSNFSAAIREAEQSGRQQASAAASGITGSVVDIIDQTSRMRRGMEVNAGLAAESQMAGDYTRREHAQRWATLDSLDYSLILDNAPLMDNGFNVGTSTSVLGAALSGKNTLKNLTQGLADFSFKDTGSDSLDAFLNLNDNFSQTEV